MVERLEPDVVRMDLKMPRIDGIEATRQITGSCPAVKVLILTTSDVRDDFILALQAGTLGHVLKDDEPDAIVSAILAVTFGHSVMARPVADRMLELLTGSVTTKELYDGLTAREVEILRFLATGALNKADRVQPEDQREGGAQPRQQHIRESRHRRPFRSRSLCDPKGYGRAVDESRPISRRAPSTCG